MCTCVCVCLLCCYSNNVIVGFDTRSTYQWHDYSVCKLIHIHVQLYIHNMFTVYCLLFRLLRIRAVISFILFEGDLQPVLCLCGIGREEGICFWGDLFSFAS